MRHYITSIALTIMVVLAGCASEKVSHAQTSAQTANAAGVAVLVGRSARIEGPELIWSCVYQTAEGQVLFEQREECEGAK